MVASVNQIRSIVQKRLEDASSLLSFRLSVVGEREVDGWIQLIVRPDRDGVHSEDYIPLLAQIEGDVERDNKVHLLLVPAVPND